MGKECGWVGGRVDGWVTYLLRRKEEETGWVGGWVGGLPIRA